MAFEHVGRRISPVHESSQALPGCRKTRSTLRWSACRLAEARLLVSGSPCPSGHSDARSAVASPAERLTWSLSNSVPTQSARLPTRSGQVFSFGRTVPALHTVILPRSRGPHFPADERSCRDPNGNVISPDRQSRHLVCLLQSRGEPSVRRYGRFANPDDDPGRRGCREPLLECLLSVRSRNGCAGAALGTVIATVIVTLLFAALLVRGHLPHIGRSLVRIDFRGSYLNPPVLLNLVEIGIPVLGKRIFTRLSVFPILAIVPLYGSGVVAAYVIVRRIFDLMNTSGWGFSLACSSLVGQELGAGNESNAAYGRDVLLFARPPMGCSPQRCSYWRFPSSTFSSPIHRPFRFRSRSVWSRRHAVRSSLRPSHASLTAR